MSVSRKTKEGLTGERARKLSNIITQLEIKNIRLVYNNDATTLTDQKNIVHNANSKLHAILSSMKERESLNQSLNKHHETIVGRFRTAKKIERPEYTLLKGLQKNLMELEGHLQQRVDKHTHDQEIKNAVDDAVKDVYKKFYEDDTTQNQTPDEDYKPRHRP